MNDTEMELLVMQEFSCNREMAQTLIKSATANGDIGELVSLVKNPSKKEDC